MSTTPTLCFAYQVEVREKEEEEWQHLEIMVSVPGHAPRQVGNCIKDGSENLVRVTRIKHSKDFMQRRAMGYSIGTQVEGGMLPIHFEDAILEPLN